MNRTAEQIAHDARAIPPSEQAAFLKQACGADEALLLRVQMLLMHDDSAGDPQQTWDDSAPTAGAAPRPIADTLREGPGTHIGPYKLLQLIGEGGFGSVFMAEQERPVQRKVALKIIKLGMDTRAVIARFEAERQALAMMDHPNIAKVLDAGATETGRPYFVMQLCKGEAIVDYCDRNNLNISERLELFAQVCAAVQHAHTKGIIHRDIKPSNVLVSTQDGRPHAKVIDFGIAKATSARLTEKTLFTEHRQLIGTPEYMSPEQAEGSLDIDTRTDVYSLGVLLYELLTGSTPFSGRQLRSVAYGEIQRIIREVEPPKPSTRLSQSTDTIASVAARRHTEPKKLGTIIRGDLDWIVMKAVEKDRQRRYETANGLAMDIRRHLTGEAVVAAPPSAAYRMRKFVRRHRVQVAAAGLVAAAVIMGLAGTAWQAHVASEQAQVARRAEAAATASRDAEITARKAAVAERELAEKAREAEATQRNLAETSAGTAKAINDFLIAMLGAANVREVGRNVTVAEAMKHASAGVATAFADRPAVEAGVRQVLGKTYASIGMLDEAEPHIQRAMDIYRQLEGEQSAGVAEGLSHLSFVKSQRGDPQAAADLARQACDIFTALYGPDSARTLSMRSDYANTLARLGNQTEAEQILRQTLDARRRLHPGDVRQIHILTNSLAVLMHEMDRLDDAEALYREAVVIGAAALGADDSDTLTARMNLASLLRSRRKFTEAEPAMLETYQGIRRVYGESSVRTAAAAANLGGLYKDMGRPKDALPYVQEGLATYQRAQGDRTRQVADSKVSLALLLSSLGEPAKAVTLQQEAVEVYATLWGAEHLQVLLARLDLANLLVRADRFAEAETIFKELLATLPRVAGEDATGTVITTNSYGVLLMRQDRYAEAEPFVRKALEAGRRTAGADNHNTIITQHNLCVVLREAGRLDEAASLSQDALERFVRVHGPRHANIAVVRSAYAETLSRLSRFPQALQEIRAAIDIAAAALGENNPTTAAYRVILGTITLNSGDAAAAEPLLRQATDLTRTARGPDHRRTLAATVELGRCLVALGKFQEAEQLLVAAHKTTASQHPTATKDLRTAERQLADLYTAWDKAEPGKGYAAKATPWQTGMQSATVEPTGDAGPAGR